MKLSTRVSTCLLLLACSGAAASQEASSWVSAKWMPMAAENERAFKDVEAQFDTAMVKSAEARKTRPEMPLPGPDGDTMDNAPHGPPPVKLRDLLPAALDFAAPTTGALILQRTSTSVLFGRSGSDEIVVVPLSGVDTDIVHGMRASIHDEKGSLRLDVVLPTGERVEYLYHQDADPKKHGMSVDIGIGAGYPAENAVVFQRFYQRAP